MYLYHKKMQHKSSRWSLRATAKYFNVSLGLVSENLMLAARLKELKEFDYRKDALLFVRNHINQ
jgi:hypothetical protein